MSTKRSHIVKQTFSFQLQGCVSMYDLLVDTRHSKGSTKWMMLFSIIIKEHKFEEPQETLNFKHLACKEITVISCSIKCRGQKALVSASHASGSKLRPTCGSLWYLIFLFFRILEHGIISPEHYLEVEVSQIAEIYALEIWNFRGIFYRLAIFVIAFHICMTVPVVFNILIFIFLPYSTWFFQIFWADCRSLSIISGILWRRMFYVEDY